MTPAGAFEEYDVAAEPDIRMNSSLRVEINLRCPSDGRAYRELAESWFTRAVAAFAGPLGEGFHHDLDLTEPALSTDGDAPLGAPGTLWADFVYYRARRGRARLVQTHWSPGNWQRFREELENRPADAQLELSLLGADGRPDEPWLAVSVKRENQAPDVVSLVAIRTTEEFQDPATVDEAQRRWESSFRSFVERYDPVWYANIADDSEHTTGRTALEDGLGLLLEDTLPELGSTLRGYAWLTVCSPGVTAALGGVPALRASGAFAEVAALPGGGAWLKATDRVLAYTDSRVRAVFRALAPALPPGKPTPSLTWETPRLAFQDPDDLTDAT
ncbi:hypothetical protein [Streptomyces sp. NPDC005898]|uniref:hypothetical protein n=1 Tax=Streptomyces sp. NPDC005898 TaxID=3157082 RepID=UPI0033D973AD